MRLLSGIKHFITRPFRDNCSIDEVEIRIFGLNAKLIRKICLPVPHEVSVIIPRLELTSKVTENQRTTETSVILNSLTIVSSPLRESLGPQDRKARKTEYLLHLPQPDEQKGPTLD